MIDKISKAVIVFSIGITISLASIAFINQFMQMPQQAFQMGGQMMNPQQACDCRCPLPK